MVYKVLNMDIFFLQKCINSTQDALINLLCGVLFLMDGCTSLDFKISTPIHCHYKAWKKKSFAFSRPQNKVVL